MGRPGILAKLRVGLAIGAQEGFAETFNWLVDFCRNLRGGPGVKVDLGDGSHPVIRLEEQGGTEDGSGNPIVNVASEAATTGSNQSLTFTHEDGTEQTVEIDGSGKVVADISSADDGFSVEYSDGTTGTVDAPGVKFSGNNGGTTSESRSFNIQSASNSNVKVACSGSTITIGVYYS